MGGRDTQLLLLLLLIAETFHTENVHDLEKAL